MSGRLHCCLQPRAARGRLQGEGSRWQPQSHPSVRQVRGATSETCIDIQQPSLVEVSPQGQASPSVPVHHLAFSLCQLFLDVALWTSHHDARF